MLTPEQRKKKNIINNWYYHNNKAAIKIRVTEDRKANGQRHVAWAVISRCRRSGLEVDFEHLVGLPCPAVCPVFGTPIRFGTSLMDPLENKASFDRIDSTRGYVSGNVQIISALANIMKSRATADQLRSFAQWILETEMLKKHTFSPNHKVVAGPHNYSAGGGSPGPGNMTASGSGMHPSAEPMGGGAQGPSDGMQGFADGGNYTGAPSMLDNAKAAVGTAVGDYVDKAKAMVGDPVKAAQKRKQDGDNQQIDDTERASVTGG